VGTDPLNQDIVGFDTLYYMIEVVAQLGIKIRHE
jgi:hypothetical protein